MVVSPWAFTVVWNVMCRRELGAPPRPLTLFSVVKVNAGGMCLFSRQRAYLDVQVGL
jgi:hypothetical protein